MEYQKHLELGTISQTKIHTLAHLNQGVWLVSSSGSVFDLTIYVMQVCPPSYLPKAPLKSLSGRIWKRRATSKCLWWDNHTFWVIKRIIWGTCLLCKNFQKTSRKMVELGMNDKQNVCESVLSCNRQRPEIANKPYWSQDNNRVDRTCRYIRIAVENLLISLVPLRRNWHSSNSWSTTKA